MYQCGCVVVRKCNLSTRWRIIGRIALKQRGQTGFIVVSRNVLWSYFVYFGVKKTSIRLGIVRGCIWYSGFVSLCFCVNILTHYHIYTSQFYYNHWMPSLIYPLVEEFRSQKLISRIWRFQLGFLWVSCSEGMSKNGLLFLCLGFRVLRRPPSPLVCVSGFHFIFADFRIQRI